MDFNISTYPKVQHVTSNENRLEFLWIIFPLFDFIFFFPRFWNICDILLSSLYCTPIQYILKSKFSSKLYKCFCFLTIVFVKYWANQLKIKKNDREIILAFVVSFPRSWARGRTLYLCRLAYKINSVYIMGLSFACSHYIVLFSPCSNTYIYSLLPLSPCLARYFLPLSVLFFYLYLIFQVIYLFFTELSWLCSFTLQTFMCYSLL